MNDQGIKCKALQHSEQTEQDADVPNTFEQLEIELSEIEKHVSL